MKTSYMYTVYITLKSVIPFNNSSCNLFERFISFALPVDVMLKFSLFFHFLTKST